jgi:hypothetical protein
LRWLVWITFFFQGIKRNGKSHANNLKTFVQNKHVPLYDWRHLLGELDRTKKKLGLQSLKKKPHKATKERTILKNCLVIYL